MKKLVVIIKDTFYLLLYKI